MRELDFSEGNLPNRWLGVKSIWAAMQAEVTRHLKGKLEGIMRAEDVVVTGGGRSGGGIATGVIAGIY